MANCIASKEERDTKRQNLVRIRREMHEAFLKGKIQGVLDKLKKDFPEHREFLKIVRLRFKEEIGLPPNRKR